MQTVDKARQRRRRDRRTANPNRIQLTERDVDIFRWVSACRVLKGDQIQRLFFGTKSAANARLAKLYDHHYLERFFLPSRSGLMSSPIQYGLGKNAAVLLKSLGYDNLHWYPTSRVLKGEFLAHTSALADFRIAATLAARQVEYEQMVWLGENEIKADYDYVGVPTKSGVKRVPVVPDGYFCLNTPRGKAHFFVECDMATMTIERFQTKVKAYIAYKSTGDLEKRYNARNVRVLTITVGEKRLANLKRATQEAGGGNWFWFAVQSQLDEGRVLFAPVWQVAGQENYRGLVQ